MNAFKISGIFVKIMLIVACFLLCLPLKVSAGNMTVETTGILFTGTASGGELFLCDTLNRNVHYVTIFTSPGESAESVVSRLAAKINLTKPFFPPLSPPTGREIVEVVHSSGQMLTGLGGEPGAFILAGTEHGLGIPNPPTALTASYNKDGKLVLRWCNPSEGYDRIAIVAACCLGREPKMGPVIAGTSTEYVIDLPESTFDINDLDVWVIGCRNFTTFENVPICTPSNAAAIHISKNRQDELFGIPGFRGVAPNWSSWILNDSNVTPEMSCRPERTGIKSNWANLVKSAGAKPFYQIVKTGIKGGIGGVYRQFIGLTPGHKYRITVRLKVENLDPSDAVSIHASYYGSTALTVEQLAGISSLPNGTAGKQAGALVVYDANSVLLKSQFISSSMEVTLPDGVQNLTIWLRCDAKGQKCAAIDWLCLEDLSL